MNHGGFTKIKRWTVAISAFLVLAASIMLSKRGVGLGGELEWAGYAVALALTASQFMFNSEFEEWTWTLAVVGGCAYLYSINTNIIGFYYYRGISGTLFSNFDLTNFGGGIFMDVYPEMALAWVFRESKVGDFIGNIVKAFNNPGKLTQSVRYQQTVSNQPREAPQSIPKQSQSQNNRPQRDEVEIPDFLRNKLHNAPRRK